MQRLCLALLGAAACLYAHDPVSTQLTWTREISRIVYLRCLPCHAKNGSAPVPLTSYGDARPWAKAIKEEVLQRRMPPWGAVKGFGEFRNDPSLTQDEITRLAEWVEGGSPEGDLTYLPALPSPPPLVRVPAGRRLRKVVGPARLLAIRPLHSVASAQVVAKLQDGSTIPLLWLREYKQEWNRTFVYRDPVDLPRGVRIVAEPEVAVEFLSPTRSRSVRNRSTRAARSPSSPRAIGP